MDVKSLVGKMTLEEKAGMCSGKDFWRSKSVELLGIPEVMVSDGPHGLRKQAEGKDPANINDSIQAVCFPAACATACSFDRELLHTMGQALGEECQAENVSILLGPAVNIKRSPLCGRNFEYFSEDPYLASELAKGYIAGVQSKNVGTSIKHFAANNQEFRRMTCSSEIDERTLREIYLAAFEDAVKESKPWTVMCSYNRVNGVYASENHRLLTDILRDEWGFDGCVMSDWGAVDDRVEGLRAGLDLEMPGSGGITDAEIVEAVKDGSLDEDTLDTAVERILNKVFEFTNNRIQCEFDRAAHDLLAENIEKESAVLLRNEDRILPIGRDKKAAFIGAFAQKPRFQGGGSSHINPSRVTSALDAAPGVTYAQGFTLEDKPDDALRLEAVKAAREADIAVIFAGLPDAFESEGYDRSHMRMPDNQNELIRAIAEVQPNTVVVLHNGSPVELAWADKVKGILEVYLGGQAVGKATVDLLYGDANPSGKLAETFPLRLEDTPSFLHFPGDGKTAEYREGVFVGYRYYDSKGMPVRYPFGYGLSYTTFAYSELQLSSHDLHDTDTLTVSVRVKNTGDRAGKEIVQLYVADHTGSQVRPAKELRNFAKVALEPGEEQTVVMELSKRAYAWYNTGIGDWYAASGDYEILIGRSSEKIELTDMVHIESTTTLPVKIDMNTALSEIIHDPRLMPVLEPYTRLIMNTFCDSDSEESKEAITDIMMEQMIENFPLRALRSFTDLEKSDLDALIADLQNAVK
ncbi:MAG: glycoside hydrolase family 3 C-terminal domain-containing protein [Acetanaerobacterium sp.]